MKIDREVIQDLLPLYLAGEASPATRRLIEEQLAADPELALLAREASDPRLPAHSGEVATLPPSAEKSALDATRRLLRRRSWLMGGAIFTSLLPLASHGDSEGIRFLLLRDAPATAAISAAFALAFWFAWWRASRRLQVTGL